MQSVPLTKDTLKQKLFSRCVAFLMNWRGNGLRVMAGNACEVWHGMDYEQNETSPTAKMRSQPQHFIFVLFTTNVDLEPNKSMAINGNVFNAEDNILLSHS